MDSINEVLEAVKAYCKEKTSDATYAFYIKDIKAVSFENSNTITLELRSEFVMKIVSDRYTALLKEAFKAILGFDVEILYVAAPPEDGEKADGSADQRDEKSLPSGRYDFTFENFIKGPSNQFAFAAAQAVAANPSGAYNPLFIYGPSGLGKTHLLNAIQFEIKKNHPDFNIVYVDCEMFTNETISAIKTATMEQFRQKYRKADVLLIDDIQFLAGKESTQEEFFHTFNALHSAGKQIIISSDKPPREIARLEERLRSRFEWGLIADIQKPDFDTRVAILRKKADNEDIEVSDEMLELIAGRIESNIRELEGSLTRVNAYAKLNHCEINEEVISHALHDIAVVRDPKRITPELIIDCVADYYSLSADMLRGDSRKKEIALARHVAVYLTREMTGLSLPRIGDAFGRDHSTIINSCDKVTKMLDTSSDMKSSIADLKKIITEK